MRPHADDTSPAWRPPPLYPAELAITDGLKQLAVCGLPTAYRANRIDGHGLVPDSDGDHLEMVDSESSPLRASPDMLFEFARLADASSAEILAYVQKWGRLGLCDHARPSSAHLNCLTAEVEPIAAWRRYAAGFRSLLLLLTALDDNRPAPTETDWAAIEWVVPAAAHTILLLAEARYPGHERGLTASVLDALHTEAGIGTLVVWPTSASRPKLVFAIGHRSLVGDIDPSLAGTTVHDGFDVLAALFLGEAARPTGTLYLCSLCGNPVSGDRRPRRDRRSYCEACRPVAKRQRNRDHMRQKRVSSAGTDRAPDSGKELRF